MIQQGCVIRWKVQMFEKTSATWQLGLSFATPSEMARDQVRAIARTLCAERGQEFAYVEFGGMFPLFIEESEKKCTN